MSRQSATLIAAIFIVTGLSAQSYKSSVVFQKNTYTTAAIQVPYNEDVVASAVKDYMLSKGYKDAGYKDFVIYRDLPLVAGSTAVSDAYFNIERKSRSEKDVTIVKLLPVKKGQTLSPSTAEDSSFITAALAYLDSLKYSVSRFSVKKQMDDQQKVIDEIRAEMTSLKNDSGDIAKKIRNTESKLAENKNDQAKQTTSLQSISSTDQEALSKAHKKMDKLLDNQTDYEKKLRNYKADLEENTKDRETQQNLLDRASQSLTALKQRYENL